MSAKTVSFWSIWLVLFLGASLLALAIHDYERSRDENARLERVHAAGMATGANLCRSH